MDKIKPILKKVNPGYIFIMPWLIGFTFLVALPLVQSFQYSLNEVTVGPKGAILSPVGFENYIYMFTLDPKFVDALIEVSKQIIIIIPLVIILSMIIALMLSQDIKFQGTFRTIFFIPVIIMSGPILALLDEISAFSEYDQLSEILQLVFGSSGSSFLAVFGAIIIFLITNISVVLRFCGIPIIVFLVVLQRINPDLYEAADMDGASGWNKFWKVTLPSIKVAININILYLVVQMSTLDSNPVAQQIKDNMFDTDRGLGYSSGQAWVYLIVLFLIIGLLLFAVNGIKRRKA